VRAQYPTRFVILNSIQDPFGIPGELIMPECLRGFRIESGMTEDV